MTEFSEYSTDAINRLCEALIKVGETADDAAMALNRAFATIEVFAATENLKKYATDRQWYLFRHGSYRVRKKWANALIRKMLISQKRKRGFFKWE